MKQLTKSEREQIRAILGQVGLEVKSIRTTAAKPVLKSKWYKPQSLASLCKPYGKRMPWVLHGTTAIPGSAAFTSRTELCPSNWPSDIATHYALQDRINNL